MLLNLPHWAFKTSELHILVKYPPLSPLIFIIIIHVPPHNLLVIPGEFPLLKTPAIHIQPFRPSNLCYEYFKTLMSIGPLDSPPPLPPTHTHTPSIPHPSLPFCPFNLDEPFPVIVARTENTDTRLSLSLPVRDSPTLSGSAPSAPVSSLA